MTLKHRFQSALSDGADATLVRPSNWNDSHVVSAANILLGRSTAGAGDAEELTAAQAKAILAIASGDVSGLGSLATLSSVNNGNWSGTALAVANGGTGSVTAIAAARALAVSQIIKKSAVAVSTGADTSEDTLASITIPALNANDVLRISMNWAMVATANAKTMRARMNGIGGTALFSQNAATTSWNSQVTFIIYIANVNSTSIQTSWGFGVDQGTNARPQGTVSGAVDTSSSTSMVITGQKATSGDTLTLTSYVVELLSDGT